MISRQEMIDDLIADGYVVEYLEGLSDQELWELCKTEMTKFVIEEGEDV